MWRTTESFFKNEFVCLTNEDISGYFFTLNNSFLENLKYFYDHTKQLFLNIDYRIQKKDKIFQINRSKELQELNDKSQNTFVIHGEGGCGKSALIKKFMDDNPKYIFLGMKAIELNNCNDLKETLTMFTRKIDSIFQLKEDMEWMEPVRAQDVDAAQANLVKIVFRLSNNGDILLTLKEDYEKLYK